MRIHIAHDECSIKVKFPWLVYYDGLKEYARVDAFFVQLVPCSNRVTKPKPSLTFCEVFALSTRHTRRGIRIKLVTVLLESLLMFSYVNTISMCN